MSAVWNGQQGGEGADAHAFSDFSLLLPPRQNYCVVLFKKQYAQKYSDFIILKQQHMQMTVNYNITNTILNLIRISK